MLGSGFSSPTYAISSAVVEHLPVVRQYRPYPHTDAAEGLGPIFSELHHWAIENFSDQFRAIFDSPWMSAHQGTDPHPSVCTGRHIRLAAVRLYRLDRGQDIRADLKPY